MIKAHHLIIRLINKDTELSINTKITEAGPKSENEKLREHL